MRFDFKILYQKVVKLKGNLDCLTRITNFSFFVNCQKMLNWRDIWTIWPKCKQTFTNFMIWDIFGKPCIVRENIVKQASIYGLTSLGNCPYRQNWKISFAYLISRKIPSNINSRLISAVLTDLLSLLSFLSWDMRNGSVIEEKNRVETKSIPI